MNSNHPAPPADDPVLREALKRCSPATYYAACKFRASGGAEHLQAVVLGVVERFVDRDRREQLQRSSNATMDLRLREDLGLDSLTMMEIIMIAEDVLQFSTSNEELTRLRTLGEVHGFVVAKIATSSPPAAAGIPSPIETWDVAGTGQHIRQLEAATSLTRTVANQSPTHA